MTDPDWTCAHGADARRGCVACFRESAVADERLPHWKVTAWFTSERPIPVRTLQDVHRYGRRFAIDQPSTPLVYLLTGQAHAQHPVRAIAGVIGFLVDNLHVVADFNITETRAVRLTPPRGMPTSERIWP